MKRCGFFYFLLCSLLACPPIAQAQEFRNQTSPLNQDDIPLSRLTQEAAAVLEGRVVAERSFWNEEHTRIYTAYVLDVYKVFKGTVTGPQVELVVPGGVVGNQGLEVPGGLPIKVNSVGVFALSPTAQVSVGSPLVRSQQFQPLFGQQGAFIYNGVQAEKVAVGYTRQYRNPANTLYPALQQATGRVPQEVKYFDVSGYDQASELRLKRAIEQAPRNTTDEKKESSKSSGASQTTTPARPQAVSISSLSPTTITAGTSRTLVITGSGFRNASNPSEKPIVYFESADDGPNNGLIDFPAEYITSWSDTEIRIWVPSNDGTPAARTAGTGNVQVSSSNGLAVSSQVLTIVRSETTARLNTIPGAVAYRQTRLVNLNGAGGITFRYNQSVLDKDPYEYLPLRRIQAALRQWRTADNTPGDATTLLNLGDDAVASGMVGT